MLLIAAAMFFPALSVHLTRLLTKEGFRNSWLRPCFKGNLRIYLLAYFGPGILTLLGTAVYFLIFPAQLDPECGFLRATLEAAGATPEALGVTSETAGAGLAQLPLWTIVLSQTLTASGTCDKFLHLFRRGMGLERLSAAQNG